MSVMEKFTSLLTGGRAEPAGAVKVCDFSPLNWLYITYNTVEELIRVDTDGAIRPAAMKTFRWADDRTLEIELREGDRFPEGEPLTALTAKRAFDEVLRWQAPHPPGTQFNLDSRTRCEVTGEHSVRLHLPEPDGLALGKLRAVHLMNTPFWNGPGFGYARNGHGEGHW